MNAGGGVVKIDITAAGVTGSGTINQLANWTGSTTNLGTSGIVFASGYWSVSTHWVPGSSHTYDLGRSSLVWNNVYTRAIQNDNASALIVSGYDTGSGASISFQANSSGTWNIQTHSGGSAFYPDTDSAFDIGKVTTNRIRDLYLAGQVKQVGTNKAAATALAITNAPAGGAMQWVPLTFNGVAGAVLWVPV